MVSWAALAAIFARQKDQLYQLYLLVFPADESHPRWLAQRG
jgi:hypothetical protein